MVLIPVNSPAEAKEFIQVNISLNKSVPNYIRPLDKDINDVFDKAKNKAFRQGEVVRWLLKDGNGRLIGRIAFIVDVSGDQWASEFGILPAWMPAWGSATP